MLPVQQSSFAWRTVTNQPEARKTGIVCFAVGMFLCHFGKPILKVCALTQMSLQKWDYCSPGFHDIPTSPCRWRLKEENLKPSTLICLGGHYWFHHNSRTPLLRSMPGACYPGMMDVCGFGFKRITSFLSRMLLQFMCFQALFVVTTLQITPAIFCFVVALLQFIPSIAFCTGQLLHSCCRGWSPRWAARRLATGKSVELNEGHPSHWNHRGGTTQPEWLDPKSPAIGVHRHPCRGDPPTVGLWHLQHFNLWNLGPTILPDRWEAHILDPIAGTGLHGVGEPALTHSNLCVGILSQKQWPKPLLFAVYRGWYSTTQLYNIGTSTLLSHYKDPYEPISIMECHKGFVAVAHIALEGSDYLSKILRG